MITYLLRMKKRSILALLLLVAVLMQYCKKSSDDTTTTTTTIPFQAYVNNVVWTPLTTNAVLTYNAAANTKTFTWQADSTNDRIVLNNKITSSGAGTGIPLLTYNVDTTAAAKVTMTYYRVVNKVYTTVGTTRSGYITVSAIDSVAKLITGTFGFNETKVNYDSNNKIISITSTSIASGSFNSLPYTYVKQ